jgi:hypothetical protein
MDSVSAIEEGQHFLLADADLPVGKSLRRAMDVY